MGATKFIRFPSNGNLIIIRILVILGIISIIQFLYWFWDTDHIGNPWLFGLLAIALSFKLVRMLFEWFYYTSLKVHPRPETHRKWTVDMLTTFVPGEPYDMIEETLRAMVAVKYPHTTYLCDEGDDPNLKDICKKLGVVHVYRGKDKTYAKAGNINYALKKVARGEIAIILDPDHVPVPEFIDRVLPYFEDNDVGYVQCIQAYKNRNESFIAKAAAEQTYMFYGPMMMGMNRHGTAQAIGANCAFRRSALDDIGGHAAGLCEDMHTSMQMHARKWKPVYIPEMLSRGLVPATLSAYYKQQLKWSRGSFELLFKIVPKLFWKFSWQQKLHYTIAPLYYLFGVIGLIDILIPVVSLLSFEIPLFIEFDEFVLRILPVLLSGMIVRQYVQRFVLEEHEEGFHFLGGMLRAGTWWIFLLGFIYSLLNIKVPYIPTPKGDELRNEWKLSIPNIVAVGLSTVAVGVGLWLDWNPFSWFMAGFAGINIVILGTVVLISQQKMISRFYQNLYHGKLKPHRLIWYHFRHKLIYRLLRSPLVSYISIFIVSGSLLVANNIFSLNDRKVDEFPSYKNQMLTIRGYEVDSVFVNPHPDQVYSDDTSFRVLSREFEWKANGSHKELFNFIRKSKAAYIPLLYMSIGMEDTCKYPDACRTKMYESILNGQFDKQIKRLFLEIRSVNQPVMVSFDPIDQAKQERFIEEEQLSNLYRFTWVYLIKEARNLGVSNITWVWSPGNLEKTSRMYPGKLIDLIDLPYEIWSESDSTEYVGASNHPVIITGVSPGTPVGQLPTLHKQKLDSIPRYWVVHGILFDDADKGNDLSVTGNMADFIKVSDTSIFSLAQDTVLNYALSSDKWDQVEKSQSNDTPRLHGIRKNGMDNSFQLMVDGEPFYVKGVAYNPEHDWRDGEWPLTRKQLEQDFSLIKEMGANTIRRYGSSIYDDNIFNIAEKNDLKVIHGFWFDPQVDYLRDKRQVEQYKHEAIDLVKKYKDRQALLCWIIGNETWGLLKHYYQKPYLIEVRRAYIEMIRDIVAEIHHIDPDRAVFTALEYSDDLEGGLHSFYQGVPELDGIAINVYHDEQLEQLRSHVEKFFPGKPYMISEFGPKGYWDEKYVDKDSQGYILESSSFSKARLYANRWEDFIEANSNLNIGGVAYCWRDRMEGTSTWFGITDYRGRIRPTYYSLRNLWQSRNDTFPLADLELKSNSKVTIGAKYIQVNAVSPNNLRDDLRYEWYINENDYLSRLQEVSINRPILGGLISRFKEEYYEHTGALFHPVSKGKSVKIRTVNENEEKRLYLHISDKQGHVVTASIKIN